jgi:membrane protein
MLSQIRAIAKRAREERLPQVAGGLTFTTLLSVVPLLVVSFALFTRFPAIRPIGEAIRAHLLEGLLPHEISRTVLKHLAQFAGNAGGLTLVGSLFVLGSALAMLMTVENALNRIWQVKKNRPVHRRLGLYAVMLVIGLPLLGVSLWATSYLVPASKGLATSAPWAALTLQVVPVLLGMTGLAALFCYVPNAPVRQRDALIGGLLASIVIELGKRGLAFYLVHVPTYKTVYGSFAPLLVFILWVYFSWLVTVSGALLTAGMGRGGGRQPARRLSRA